MDPLSITASVIAVIGLADRIISLCRGYVTTMKDAPSDLRTIMVEAGSLKSVVTSLDFFLSTWGTGNMLHIVKSLEGPEGPLEASRKALVDLEKLFPSAADPSAAGAKRKATTTFYSKLSWPFKEEKARKILNDIARHKASISLALTTDTANDTKNIKANVERLCDALDSETREKVLSWLVKTDPSPNHNTACALHDSHTGTWITRANEYQEWKNGSSRFFWFHGIPGAGKTILFSYVVEDVKQYCKTSRSKDITCSYYYCYFGRAQDEVPHFLRWVINQLCRESQYIPTEILDSFRSGEQTSVPVLIQALSAVLRNFRYVYVMLDALDETLDRQNLLRLLNQLAGDSFEKLGLLVSSRREIDIERSLTPISTSMSLSNPYVDEDIRVYVENQLQSHHKLRSWPKSLSDEISAALVKGAKGMFRWAACQIDILGRLHNVSDIRNALHELPETLDETYERILMKIPQRFSKIAHKVLQLLAFDTRSDNFHMLDALAEAVAVDVEQLSFSPEKRLLDPMSLLEICTCLITINSGGGVYLAHYSVKEYLVSERIQCGPAKSFQISKIAFNVLTAKIYLIYLINITYEGIWSFKDWLGSENVNLSLDYFVLDEDEKFPLLRGAWTWMDLLRDSESEDEQIKTVQGPDTAILDDLLIRLFDPKIWLDYNFIKMECYSESSESIEVRSPLIWKTQPGAEAAIPFANACYYNLVRTAKKMLESNPTLATSGDLLEVDNEYRNLLIVRTGTLLDLLDVAIFYLEDKFVELLLDWGANPNGNRPNGCCKLLFALKVRFFGATGEEECQSDKKTFNIIKSLVERGADPNPAGVALTALQAAAHLIDSPVVELLLDAGAHANTVGDDSAIVASIERRSTTEEDPFIWLISEDNDPCNEDILDFDRGYLSQNQIQQNIHARSRLQNYLTPLRIVEERLNLVVDDTTLAIKNMLVDKGGRSLKRYPGENFPGHLETYDYHSSMMKGRISYIINSGSEAGKLARLTM